MPHTLLDGNAKHSVYAIGWGAPSALSLQHGRPSYISSTASDEKSLHGLAHYLLLIPKSNDRKGWSRGSQSTIGGKSRSSTLAGRGIRFAAALRRVAATRQPNTQPGPDGSRHNSDRGQES